MLPIIALTLITAAHLVPGFHLNFPANPDASGNTVVDWTFNPNVDPPTFNLLLACNCAPFPVLSGVVSSSSQVLTFNIEDHPNGEYWLRAVDVDDNEVLSNSDPFSLFAVGSGLTLSPLPTTLPLTPIPGPLTAGFATPLLPTMISTVSHTNAGTTGSSTTTTPLSTATTPMTTITTSTFQGINATTPTLTSNVSSLRNASISSSGVATIITSISIFTSTSTITGTTPVSTVFRSGSRVGVIVGSTVGGLAGLLLIIFFLFFCRKKLRQSSHHQSRALTHPTTACAPEDPGFIVPSCRSSILLAENRSWDNPTMGTTYRIVPQPALQNESPDKPNMLEPRMISPQPHDISPPTASHNHEQNYQPQRHVHESQPNQNKETPAIVEPLVEEIYATAGLATNRRQSHVLRFVRHTDIAEGVELEVQVELPPKYCENRPRLLGLTTSEVGSLIPKVQEAFIQ